MSEGLSGSLAQLPLRDLLRMLSAGEQSGRIDVTSGTDHGIIFMRRGTVIHATADAAVGEVAFAAILAWAQGTFRFDPAVSAAETSIYKPLDQLLAETARQLSEREVLRKAIPSADAVPHLAPTIPAESVTIVAADWEVLAQIDGVKTVADLGRTLGRSDLDMVRLLYRLKQAGYIGVRVDEAGPAAVALAGQAFFGALTPAVAAAMGPLAQIIIDDTLELLGFTRATLPRSAMAAVTERISMEIRDSAKRVKYQQSMLEFLRGHAA